ncbi:MAG: hypothetical protein QXQ19_01505 [Candidatus Aenigmatarchaeota archaeon]
MKSQYILISSIIIVSILSYYILSVLKTNIDIKSNLFEYVKNFENEIFYISKNFDKSKILDFVQVYRDYLISNQLEMKYICIVSEKFYDNSINKCSNQEENCCYVIRTPIYFENLKYCNISFLFKEMNMICICYNISKENNFYINLICV